MKINSSAVALSGKQSYSRYQETKVQSITMRAEQWKALQEGKAKESKDPQVSISEQSQSMFEQLKEQREKSAKKQEKSIADNLMQTENTEQTEGFPQVSTEEDQMIKTLRRILEMLKQMRKEGRFAFPGFSRSMNAKDLIEEDSHFSTTTRQQSIAFGFNQSISVADIRSSSSVSAGRGTAWIRHTETSGYLMEQENTTFSATGVAKTADGREIEFGVNLEMSRGFAGAFFSSKDEEVVLTDPLVINIGSATASLSDQKFFFDLDTDGKKEEISSLGEGSGFLAYDKNGDGVINDGSELFGTKSGDGFADLAKYDEDGNGWIDENDRIFKDLKVWTKNGDGSDRLLDLKEANVGAIYLGSADTQYHLNEAYTNRTNGVIQKTGVFLHETGEVGTIQHVDLAV